jgi:hypothetical protein
MSAVRAFLLEKLTHMKKLAILVGFWAAAGFLSVACGDSDDGGGDDGSKGGSSGTAGAAGTPATGGTAGTPGTGGAAGAGVTGGAAGSATGGVAGMGGAADGGVGAEGGNGDGGVNGGGEGPGTGMCPAAEPMPMTMCPTRGLSCDFGDRVCRCNVNTGNWNCFDENGTCPAMPDPNGDCMGGMTACSYGEGGTCVCVMGNFTCDSGVVACPAARPTDGAGCNMFPAGFDCPYTAGDCTCTATGGGGMMRNWNCQDAACPAMAPDNADACPTPGLICDYTTPGPGADPTCVCNAMSQWTCF